MLDGVCMFSDPGGDQMSPQKTGSSDSFGLLGSNKRAKRFPIGY